jgi:seryl-tRNA synthetase
MLDIKLIRENPEAVKTAAKNKGVDIDIDHLLEVDKKKQELQQKVQRLQEERNALTKEIAGKPSPEQIEKGKEIRERLEKEEKDFKVLQEELDSLLLKTPNIPSPDAPVGPNADSNIEISKWGEIPEFNFEAKDHVELGTKLNIVDLEKGVKTSGFRGYYLINDGARLHWAILQFAMDKILEAGFSLVVPPTLVHEKALVGSGHFPFGAENVYQILNPGKLENGDEIKNPTYLAGTSESALLAYFMDTTFSKSELPKKVCALTSCYRSEVGDYGRDTRGLYRVHEFTKVEQVIICENDLELSEKYFAEMQEISENILQDLKIPYHVLSTSTGDMGAGKYRMNDIEAWMPGRNKYGETHSCSNLTDWQARRLNIRVKDKDGKTYFAYTLNNTVIASPRILIAIIENYQQEDGSVMIPEVLRKYMGKDKITLQK